MHPRLPHPIAEAWHQCGMCRKGTAEHLDNLLICHQITLRTLVAIQLADYLNGARSKKLDEDLKKHLPKPSDGHWAAFLLHLTQHLAQRPEPAFLAECAAWHAGDAREHIKVLIESRNQVRHGATPSGAELQELTSRLEGHLVSLLKSLAWLSNYELVHLYENVTLQATGSIQGRWQSLSGRDLMTTPFDVHWKTTQGALAQNIIYLLDPDRTRALVLAPWMRLLETENPRHFYLLSKVHKWKDPTLHARSNNQTLDASQHPDPYLAALEQPFPDWFAAPGNPGIVQLDLLSRDSFPRYESAPAPPVLTRHKLRKTLNTIFRGAMWSGVAMVGCLGAFALTLLLGGVGIASYFWPSGSEVPSQVAHVVRNSPSGLSFARIEPGTFQMGSPSTEVPRSSNESIHEVELTRPFLLQTTEVTVHQWQQLMGPEYPSYKRDCGNDCPAELVSWYDALAFLNRLSSKEGLETCYELRDCNDAANIGAGCPLTPESKEHDAWCGVQLKDGRDLAHRPYMCEEVVFKGLDCEGYRLPTEAEWEYAARGGHPGPHHGETLDAVAWYGAPSGKKIYVDKATGKQRESFREFPCPYGAKHPVGQKQPNAWGLYDMIGNVNEWVWDAYGAYPDGSVTDPLGPASGSPPGHRIYRGGSECDQGPRNLRFAFRGHSLGRNRSCMVGFRVARTIQP